MSRCCSLALDHHKSEGAIRCSFWGTPHANIQGAVHPLIEMVAFDEVVMTSFMELHRIQAAAPRVGVHAVRVEGIVDEPVVRGLF